MLVRKALVIILLSALSFTVCSGATITTIKAVKNLDPTTAAQKITVEIEAQVIHLNPRRNGGFIFDGELGIYIELPGTKYVNEELTVGSIIKIKGHSSPGGFVPVIHCDELEVLDWGPLPKPRKFHQFELTSPSTELDAEWVYSWGRIIDLSVAQDLDHIAIILEAHDSIITVQIPYSKGAYDQLSDMLFQRVEFRAVVGTVFNKHRQMTGRVFVTNSVDDFTLNSEDTELDYTDLRPIEHLMRTGANYQKALNTRGLVTYSNEDRLYLRGKRASLKVTTLGNLSLEPGDFVEMLGFIQAQPISPAFRAREVSVLEKRPPPKPHKIDLRDPIDPDWNYELVEVTATLVNIGESFRLSGFSSEAAGDSIEPDGLSLLCQAGDRVFEARLPTGMAIDGELRAGAVLQLIGICNLVRNEDTRWQMFSESLWLDLRPLDGVAVLQSAPWWTTARLLWLMTIVLAIAALFFIWIVLLRKNVAKQTAIISDQIERESILQERQRIARDLHDTLEQGLAGMTLQLRSCNRKIDSDPEKGKEALRQAQGMLRYCREESRNSILDLRGGPLETMDLADAIQESIAPLKIESKAGIELTVRGNRRRLQQYEERHLLRIATEAVTNAVRHAVPTEVHIELNFQPNKTILRVSDNGSGFNLNELDKSERFGLQGMRERSNRIQAHLKIESTIGEGTNVFVELPYDPQNKPETE
ncbi:MAG: sensor histidine kinase [Verrucomicrobiota bacterium]